MKMILKSTDFVPANKVKIPDIYFNRLKTGLVEVDEFLGGAESETGGFLRGGVYLLAAGAGTGKSTFCLQLAQALHDKGVKVAHASGEESIEQLAFACKRLNVKDVPIAVQSDIDVICEKMSEFEFIVIDSFQTLSTKKQMTPRKKEQHCIAKICARAKETKCTVIALCHLTKAGVYKGSTAVLHGVDACINLNVDEEENTLRVFTWSKNRFGPADKEMIISIGKKGYEWTKEDSSEVKEVVEPEHTTDIIKIIPPKNVDKGLDILAKFKQSKSQTS
jgi:predicted ATP-dependent serine protease